MDLTKGFLVALCCVFPVAADSLKGSELPPRLARQIGRTYLYGHRLPDSRYYLVLGEHDPVTETSLCWLFKLHADGRYRLLREHLVEGDWNDSRYLQYFSLENGDFAVSRPGSVLSVLVFSPKRPQAPEYFSFTAPSEASPWAVPGYRLNRWKGRLVVELTFDTPDGPSDRVTREYQWDSRGFGPAKD